MKNISLTREKVYRGKLILVNADHPLSDSSQEDMIPVDTRFSDILLQREPANTLQRALADIGASGEIVPVSGYRTIDEQIKIYRDSLKDNGEDFTKKYVALPNRSEHQTGLAIDLGMKKDVIDFIRPEFPHHGICNEFRRLAPLYGFIERYQNGKESITGIAAEPWHFRYVGYPHSAVIKKNHMALEEYIEWIKQYEYGRKWLKIHHKGERIDIFYVPVRDHRSVNISVPGQGVCQISGNNQNGFIVTVWRNDNERQ